MSVSDINGALFGQEVQGQTNLSYILLYAEFRLKRQKHSDA